MSPPTFNVNVGDTEYFVQPVPADDCIRFKISTAGKYLFTLCMTEEGKWELESDVTPMDAQLIEKIGRAIEDHYQEPGP